IMPIASHLSKEKRQSIINLRTEGQSVQKIAKTLNASPSAADADVYMKPWYAAACDRKTLSSRLITACFLFQDGAFMVRKSSGQDAQQPYTLVVFYKGRVYNIPIRFIPSTQQYALGSEKKGEEYFSSISHIVENHQRTPLVLIDSHSNSKDTTKLCFPVKP
uniref:SH2 domain-containing protein n=1 Tax=Acanthochromis polyacanthus TaxID=80966 RepID=A0A3Q1F3S5_9TELE